MRGIQFFHYKSLQENLRKLKEDSLESPQLQGFYKDAIRQHEEKLRQIYEEYQKGFENISSLTRQFDLHKEAIHRLIKMHQQYKKSPKKFILKHLDSIGKNNGL